MREDVVLCAANAYHQKYYLNPEYGNLPEDVQKELKLIAVDYVEEIGGVFLMSFNAEQKLVLKPENPSYAPLVFRGEELNHIHILGRAVAMQCKLR